MTDEYSDRYIEVRRKSDNKLFYMLSGQRCIKCGKYQIKKQFFTCYDCEFNNQLEYIDFGYFFGHYDAHNFATPLTRELLNAKTNHQAAIKLGQLLTMLAKRKEIRVNYIVPVPKRMNSESLIDETKIIAEELAKDLKVEVKDALYFNSPTSPMKGLSKSERAENIRDKISFSPGAKVNGEVGLVDDIITCGTTMNECAKILKMNGARKVYAICVARTVPTGEKPYVR